MSTDVLGTRWRTSSVASSPSMSGIRRSMITTSGRRRSVRATADEPSAASPITRMRGERDSASRSPSRTTSWSSTRRHVISSATPRVYEAPRTAPASGLAYLRPMQDAAARIEAELGPWRRAWRRDPSWFRAPGRVNVVGDHTDYNEGFVLPFAIDRDCVVAGFPTKGVRVRSLDLGGVVEIEADGSTEPATVE